MHSFSRSLFLALSLGWAVSSVGADKLPGGKGSWVDLSHDFSSETLYWPTDDGFALEVNFRGVTPKGFFYASNRFRCAEHGGTHIDAPVHFARDRKSVDDLTPEDLSGYAAVIDVSAAVENHRDYQVTVADIAAWEKKHGRIRRGAIVLFRTGFARHWPNAEKYLGTAEKGPDAVPKLHFPGLHPEAAKWLVKERVVKAVGIDTASIDFGQSSLFETHRALFEHNIPAFENVAGLDQLPPVGAYVVGSPMKIKGGTGGPLRLTAWVPQSRRK